MHRGTKIDILTSSAHIPEEALAAIGVSDGSVCWGAWIPDRSTKFDNEIPTTSESPYQHLLISPFEPKSWPILFRLELYLKNTRSGTLAQALGAIRETGLSIHAIDASPAGHHHAAVNIICEAVGFKSDSKTFDEIKNARSQRSNSSAWNFVHSDFAPRMLHYTKSVCDAILAHDENENFIREIFLPPETPHHQKGVLYSYANFPEGTIAREIGKEQSTKGICCEWLQNHAFFYLYQHSETFELKYSSSTGLLKPTIGMDEANFRAGTDLLRAPITTIATINLRERFFRAMPSDEDRRGRTLRINIPFEGRYPYNEGSRGFQHELYTLLSSKGFSLRDVSMLTKSRRLDGETGALQIVASYSEPLIDQAELSRASRLIEECVQGACNAVTTSGRSMTCQNVAIHSFDLPLLFVSTKLEWIRRTRPNLWSQIEDASLKCGYRAIIADSQRRREIVQHVPQLATAYTISNSTVELIKRASCFLQILPRTVLDDGPANSGGASWPLFELGAALARGIPTAILVDAESDFEYSKWDSVLKVIGDHPVERFSSLGGDSEVMKGISAAINQLPRPYAGAA